MSLVPALKNTQQMRTLMPQVVDIFILKSDHPLMQRYEEEYNNYIAAVKEDPKQVPHPPWYYTFPAVMEQLCECDIGQKNKAELKR